MRPLSLCWMTTLTWACEAAAARDAPSTVSTAIRKDFMPVLCPYFPREWVGTRWKKAAASAESHVSFAEGVNLVKVSSARSLSSLGCKLALLARSIDSSTLGGGERPLSASKCQCYN